MAKKRKDKTVYLVLAAMVGVMVVGSIAITAGISGQVYAAGASREGHFGWGTYHGTPRSWERNQDCVDSDNGLFYGTRGVVTYTLNGMDYYAKTDFCFDPGALIEYSCNVNGRVVSNRIRCTCVDGTCPEYEAGEHAPLPTSPMPRTPTEGFKWKF